MLDVEKLKIAWEGGGAPYSSVGALVGENGITDTLTGADTCVTLCVKDRSHTLHIFTLNNSPKLPPVCTWGNRQV